MDRLDQLNQYFQTTWCDAPGNTRKFELEFWNVSHLDDHQTNNDVEGFHNVLGKRLGRHKQNFWEFLNKLKDYENNVVHQDFLQQVAGQEINRPRNMYRDINNNLLALKQQFNAGMMNANQYITQIVQYVYAM